MASKHISLLALFFFLSLRTTFCEPTKKSIPVEEHDSLTAWPVSALGHNSTPGSECWNHSLAYSHALLNFSYWAMAMHEASSLSMEGHLAGNTFHLGNFDECLELDVATELGRVYGQYCLAHLQFDVPHVLSRDPQTFGPYQSFWEAVQVSSTDRSKFSRMSVHWAICIPASCSPQQLQDALQSDVSFGDFINFSAAVPIELCQTAESVRHTWTYADITFSTLLMFLCFVVVASTLFDIFTDHETDSSIARFLLCFSAKQNLHFLTGGDLAGSGFDAIHGLRLLFMILAIAGHRFMVNFGGPLLNDSVAEKGYDDPTNMFILNGMIVVDTFFVYSGCLTAYYLPLELDKHHFNPLLVWLYRFIRLTPVYLVTVVFHATLLIHLGSGPLWPTTVGVEARRCADNWWANILYLNNYISVDNMCMFQTWYLAVDTHLFMLAVLVVYCMWRHPPAGYILFSILSIFSICIPFLVTYTNRADAFLLLYQNVISDPVQSEYFQTMYAATHMRAGPYMVGVATGFALYKLNSRQLHIPKACFYTGHIACVLICLSAQFSGFMFYVRGRSYDPLESAVYSALHRTAWGVGIALNLFLLVRGKKEWLHRVLTWTALVPISRLTYCAYLVHTISHLYELGSLRTPVYPSYYTGIWMFTGDILYTFATSLVLCLTVEAPFRAVEKMLFGRRKTTDDKDHMNEAVMLEGKQDGNSEYRGEKKLSLGNT